MQIVSEMQGRNRAECWNSFKLMHMCTLPEKVMEHLESNNANIRIRIFYSLEIAWHLKFRTLFLLISVNMIYKNDFQ